MRMTNKIMRNNSLYNINQNKLNEDKLNNQMTNQSKINRPSDDPVVAIRALRLRTNVTTVSQYYDKNAPDADSWLSLTGDALDTVGKVLTDLYKQATDASKKSYTYADLDIVLTQMKSLTKEFYASGNVDYAGRYIFSGYRTDTPITFTEENIEEFNKDPENLKTFVIEETLGYDNITQVSYTNWKDAEDETAVSNTTLYRFRLSYNKLDMSVPSGTKLSPEDLDLQIYRSFGPTEDDMKETANGIIAYDDAETAYKAVADGECEVAYIPSTGEIVFSEDYYNKPQNIAENMTLRVKYSKSNWSEGDINPVHYFHTVECDQKSVKDAMKLEAADETLNDSKKAISNAQTALESMREIVTTLVKLSANPAGVNQDTVDNFAADAKDAANELLATAEKEAELAGIDLENLPAEADQTDDEKAIIKAWQSAQTVAQAVNTAFDNMKNSPNASTFSDAIDAGRNMIAATPAVIKAAEQKTREYQIEVNRIRNLVTEYNRDEQDQDIYYDVGFNQNIQVNTHADEVFTHGARRDIDDFDVYLKQLQDVENKINDIETKMMEYPEDSEEYKDLKLKLDAANKAYTYVRDNIQTKFENQITKYQKYIDETNVAVTNNGTRGSRLDLISSRLMNQKSTFKDLQSNNEDVDMSEVAVQLKSSELTYEAALMATSKIMQTNLMNYI